MSGDFRYNTGATAVPWPAVGEAYDAHDAAEVVRFLMKPGDDADAYRQAMADVESALGRLAGVSTSVTKLTTGAEVQKLEAAVAEYLGSEHALFCTSWTSACEIACHFAGIGPGDEVIVPAITFFATATNPLSVGAKLVIADVDPRTLNMDPADVARKITPRTRAIMPVHLGGWPVDMDPIMTLAREHDITVIEDAAHAFGASYKGKMAGTIGHFGAYSFHEVKNVTSFGEGGILVSDEACGEEFAKARFIGFDASHQIDKWLYDVVALKGKRGYFPGRMCPATEIQALGLRLQFERMGGIIERRRQAAAYLTGRFEGVKGIVPQLLDSDTIKSSYHLYLLQLDPDVVGADIQQFKAELTSRGVTEIAHFAPLYKFSALRQLGYDADAMQEACPVAEEAFQRRFTHLPLYGLTREQIEYMADAVIASVEALSAKGAACVR